MLIECATLKKICWRDIISGKLTRAEKTKFKNLLELASSSSFEGERKNAIAAATRIADKHNLSLEQAAILNNEKRTNEPISKKHSAWRPFFQNSSIPTNTEEGLYNLEKDKARWLSALKKARKLGLGEAPKNVSENKFKQRKFSKSKRQPVKHAQILLHETSLSFYEISEITDLDIYTVVGLKLKLRVAA